MYLSTNGLKKSINLIGFSKWPKDSRKWLNIYIEGHDKFVKVVAMYPTKHNTVRKTTIVTSKIIFSPASFPNWKKGSILQGNFGHVKDFSQFLTFRILIIVKGFRVLLGGSWEARVPWGFKPKIIWEHTKSLNKSNQEPHW